MNVTLQPLNMFKVIFSKESSMEKDDTPEPAPTGTCPVETEVPFVSKPLHGSELVSRDMALLHKKNIIRTKKIRNNTFFALALGA